MKTNFETMMDEHMLTDATFAINDLMVKTVHEPSEYAVDLAVALKSWLDDYFEDTVTSKQIFTLVANGT